MAEIYGVYGPNVTQQILDAKVIARSLRVQLLLQAALNICFIMRILESTTMSEQDLFELKSLYEKLT